MFHLTDMIWIETRKATRSLVPLFTVLGFMMLPLAAAFFMIVLKDPEVARRAGLISDKSRLIGSTADWPTYFSMFSQGVGVGGGIVFSVIMSWVFGREFADGTFKDMLAVPVSRSAMLLAKFIVVSVWSALLVVIVTTIGLIAGMLLDLPQGTDAVLLGGIQSVVISGGLVIAVITPVGLFACAGRGYLPPIGVTFLLVALANIITVAGWGAYFPWSIPGLYASAGGGTALEPVSYWIVAVTALAGIGGTYWWWKTVDQNK